MSFAKRILLVCLSAVLPVSAWAQGQVFRCGNEYTNDPQRAGQQGCTALERGPVMVVPGTKVVRPERAATVRPSEAGPSMRLDPAQQRARDADARAILEAELRKAEARLAQLQSEYKNGEPDKQGIEGRNHQRYLDRVQALREDLARQQSDVASLKRELARLPVAAGASVAGSP
jgi:hypothetical protein